MTALQLINAHFPLLQLHGGGGQCTLTGNKIEFMHASLHKNLYFPILIIFTEAKNHDMCMANKDFVVVKFTYS